MTMRHAPEVGEHRTNFGSGGPRVAPRETEDEGEVDGAILSALGRMWRPSRSRSRRDAEHRVRYRPMQLVPSRPRGPLPERAPAASSFTTPSCSHRALAPIATARRRSVSFRSPEHVDDVYLLRDVGEPRVGVCPKTDVSRGFTGTTWYPSESSFCMIPCDGLAGFDDAPTIAIVRARVSRLL